MKHMTFSHHIIFIYMLFSLVNKDVFSYAFHNGSIHMFFFGKLKKRYLTVFPVYQLILYEMMRFDNF